MPTRCHLQRRRAKHLPRNAGRSPSNRSEDGGVSKAMSRVAVVTGAASGIGLGVARRFAAEGHRVALLDRSGEAAEMAAAELREQGATAVACEVDVVEWSAVSAPFQRVR